MLALKGLSNGIAGDDGVFPTWSRIPSIPPDVTSRSSRGEQQLVIELSEFALRVIWWPVTVNVTPSAISRNNKFILREIEDDDSPGSNLGGGLVRDDCENHKKYFPHINLLLGESSWLAFDRQRNQHICFGCTISISQDAHAWYEIIATQRVLGSPKCDLSNLRPSQE